MTLEQAQQLDMQAFDALPRSLRLLLSEAPICPMLMALQCYQALARGVPLTELEKEIKWQLYPSQNGQGVWGG